MEDHGMEDQIACKPCIPAISSEFKQIAHLAPLKLNQALHPAMMVACSRYAIQLTQPFVEPDLVRAGQCWDDMRHRTYPSYQSSSRENLTIEALNKCSLLEHKQRSGDSNRQHSHCCSPLVVSQPLHWVEACTVVLTSLAGSMPSNVSNKLVQPSLHSMQGCSLNNIQALPYICRILNKPGSPGHPANFPVKTRYNGRSRCARMQRDT